MPVSADTVQFSYTGDGSTTVFPFPSRFLSNVDIIVGVAGSQVLTGFTVTGEGNDAGGNVTFAVAPANGAKVTLIRAPAISQLLDFVNNQTVLAENIDNGLDKLTIIAQYLEYLIDRTIRLSQFDTALTGSYDLQGRRIGNAAAPVDANDLARLVDLQSVVSGSGNVPLPTVGQIGYRLQALATGIFGWAAAGAAPAPDGTLSAPGYPFANETNTGFLRPSAGLLQTSVLGALKTEVSATALRLLVPILHTNATITAGTNAQGQGAMTEAQNTVTSTPNNPSGVTLPTAVTGRRVVVANRGTNPINIYPASGAQIGALAVNVSVQIAVGQVVEFFARSSTQWEGQLNQPLDADLTALAAPAYVRGDIIRRDASGLNRLALGSDATFLGSDGTDVVYRALGGSVAGVTLTGASTLITTAIPSAARRVTISWRNLSTDSTTIPLIRIGAGSLLTTGYDATVYMGTVGGSTETTGFPLFAPILSTASYDGSLILTRQAGDWFFGNGTMSRPGASLNSTLQGYIQVTGGINRVSFNGNVSNFDAGTAYVMWDL